MLEIATSHNEERERADDWSIHKDAKTALVEAMACVFKEIPNYTQCKGYLLSKAVHF